MSRDPTGHTHFLVEGISEDGRVSLQFRLLLFGRGMQHPGPREPFVSQASCGTGVCAFLSASALIFSHSI